MDTFLSQRLALKDISFRNFLLRYPQRPHRRQGDGEAECDALILIRAEGLDQMKRNFCCVGISFPRNSSNVASWLLSGQSLPDFSGQRFAQLRVLCLWITRMEIPVAFPGYPPTATSGLTGSKGKQVSFTTVDTASQVQLKGAAVICIHIGRAKAILCA